MEQGVELLQAQLLAEEIVARAQQSVGIHAVHALHRVERDALRRRGVLLAVGALAQLLRRPRQGGGEIHLHRPALQIRQSLSQLHCRHGDGLAALLHRLVENRLLPEGNGLWAQVLIGHPKALIAPEHQVGRHGVVVDPVPVLHVGAARHGRVLRVVHPEFIVELVRAVAVHAARELQGLDPPLQVGVPRIPRRPVLNLLVQPGQGRGPNLIRGGRGIGCGCHVFLLVTLQNQGHRVVERPGVLRVPLHLEVEPGIIPHRAQGIALLHLAARGQERRPGQAKVVGHAAVRVLERHTVSQPRAAFARGGHGAARRRLHGLPGLDGQIHAIISCKVVFIATIVHGTEGLQHLPACHRPEPGRRCAAGKGQRTVRQIQYILIHRTIALDYSVVQRRGHFTHGVVEVDITSLPPAQQAIPHHEGLCPPLRLHKKVYDKPMPLPRGREVEVCAVFALLHPVIPRPAQRQLEREAVLTVRVKGVRVHQRQQVNVPLRAGQGYAHGQLGKVGVLPRGDGNLIRLPRLPSLGRVGVPAHAAHTHGLLTARDLDAPVLRRAALREDEGQRAAAVGEALLQRVQGLFAGEGLPAPRLAGHQAPRDQGQHQHHAHQQDAVLLMLEEVGQPPFELPLPASEAGGKGGSGAAGRSLQQDLAVAAAERPVLIPHHVVVAAVLQVPPGLPGHEPHQGVEPVHGVAQQHQALVGHVPPFQVGQLVAQHHLQLPAGHGPPRQQDDGAQQPQHHGRADPSGAEQAHRAADPAAAAQRLQKGQLPLLRRTGGPQQGPPGRGVGQQLPQQEDPPDRQPHRRSHPGHGHRAVDGGGRLHTHRRGLPREDGGPTDRPHRICGARRRGGQAERVSGGLHRYLGPGQRELHRDQQAQGQQEPQEVAGAGGVAAAQTGREQQQGQQHRRAGQGQDGDTQKHYLHLNALPYS